MQRREVTHRRYSLTEITNEFPRLISSQIAATPETFRFRLEGLEQYNIESIISALREVFRLRDESFVIAFIYLRRLKVTLTEWNIRPFFLIALAIATKFYSDFPRVSLQEIGKIASINTRLLEELETQFLDCIHFSLLVSEDDWNKVFD